MATAEKAKDSYNPLFEKIVLRLDTDNPGIVGVLATLADLLLNRHNAKVLGTIVEANAVYLDSLDDWRWAIEDHLSAADAEKIVKMLRGVADSIEAYGKEDSEPDGE